MAITPLADHDWNPFESHPVASGSRASPSNASPSTTVSSAATNRTDIVDLFSEAKTVPLSPTGQLNSFSMTLQGPSSPPPRKTPSSKTRGRSTIRLHPPSKRIPASETVVETSVQVSGGSPSSSQEEIKAALQTMTGTTACSRKDRSNGGTRLMLPCSSLRAPWTPLDRGERPSAGRR